MLEDETIVALYLRRDEEAIAHTCEKYGPRLRALARGIVEDPATAEECENDTYLQAWNSIPPHEPRTYLYAFLARITRHIALNRCRQQRQPKRSALLCELSAELEQCLPAPDDVECRITDLEFQQMIHHFLSTLPEEQRTIFIRRYWYCDSIAAIAARFSLSESKVKTTLFRCRKRLRTYLEKEGYVL